MFVIKRWESVLHGRMKILQKPQKYKHMHLYLWSNWFVLKKNNHVLFHAIKFIIEEVWIQPFPFHSIYLPIFIIGQCFHTCFYQRCQPLKKEKSIFEDEKKYFCLKNSIFHFVSTEVYTKWSLKKKKYFEAFCSKSQVFATWKKY